jgi:tight adherence protein C
MPDQLTMLVVVVFASVASATAALVWYVTDPGSVTRRRLVDVVGTRVPTQATIESVLLEQPSRLANRLRSWVPKSPADMNRLQRLLATAGYLGPWPPILYGLSQIATAIVLALLVFSILSGPQRLVFTALAGIIGYFLPSLWLGRAIARRKKAIQDGLPDAIDLMIVCIESGSGIDQAIAKVSEELGLAHPDLARELDMISAEIRAGKARLEAFKNFADRTKVDDVRSLVAMLVQTDRFGTSVGQALRTHADTSRTKRRQRAEEKAAKLAVKLLFPLVFFLFPAFYTVVLGPAAIQIIRTFAEIQP